MDAFDYTDEKKSITIDFSQAHIWDDSAVGAIDKVVLKLRENANNVNLIHLNEPSQKLVDSLAISAKQGKTD